MEANEARVNVTYAGKNGDLADPVHFDSTDGDLQAMVTEALRNGGVIGISADPNADLSDFVIDRFSAPTNPSPGERDYNLLSIRPKVPFGA